ncbi:MAG: NADP-dependent malic enzyme [candidate division NC10 bacterium]|nr:NADP-dependent malic enzyme [candidate division NC10 bacterium]
MSFKFPKEEALEYRRRYRGVIGVQSKVPIRDKSILSLVYTPGVAAACLEIAKIPATSFDYTCRGNTVTIITDGSAVLGLGNVGPEAALPVMEGKSVIFKTFAGVDAFPICLATQDPDEIVETVAALAPTFGGVCLEDIAAPRCFTIADQLQRAINVPIFANHQHATAIQVLAGLYNALKLVDKRLEEVSVVINGAGAAGIGVARLLLKAGVKRMVLCDREGAIYKYRLKGMNWAKGEIAQKTNPEDRRGDLAAVLRGADVFIGLSAGKVVTAEMVASMARDPIVFALALPEPEVHPNEAKQGGAKVVATGRPDFPNELDIALVFPGFFRGLLDVRARNINDAMLFAAAEAIAGLVDREELDPDYIIPQVLDFRVAPAIAAAVAKAAMETGEARVQVDPEEIAERTRRYVYEGRLPLRPRSPTKAKTVEEEALELRRRYQGVLEVKSKIPIKDHFILSLFYLPPGAIEPCRLICQEPMKVYDYTAKGNLVAIITDGSAVLGLGNIGPRAALPVMEGKAVLFKTFAGVEAFPICLATQDPDEIAELVKRIVPAFGGINLEDISAPRCFYIEERLKKETDIPIFHDDQHGTAVVVLAGLINALKLVGKRFEEARVVINGAGAGGIAVAKILLAMGIKNLILCDTQGAIYEGRGVGMNWAKEEMAKVTNREGLKGSLGEVIPGSDVFIGLSVAGALSQEMVRSMARDPIVFAMANPIPEILPEEAKQAGAAVVATGRSDFDNQVNNSLGFPGIFRGALDVRARNINQEMKLAAAFAIADLVSEKELRPDYIIPFMMDFRVPPRVAAAVAKAAMESGVARIQVDPEGVAENTRNFIYEGQLSLVP